MKKTKNVKVRFGSFQDRLRQPKNHSLPRSHLHSGWYISEYADDLLALVDLEVKHQIDLARQHSVLQSDRVGLVMLFQGACATERDHLLVNCR